MTITISNLKANLVKALLFDVAVTIGIQGIEGIKYNFDTLNKVTHIFTGAFIAYSLRDVARDYKHPWIGGFVAGAIKYATKDGKPLLGAFNNLAYEYTKDHKVPYELESVLIEGTEEMISKIYESYQKNNSTTEITISGINGALSGAIQVGFSLVGIGATIYEPIVKVAEKLPTFVTAPIAVLSLFHCANKTVSAIGQYYLDDGHLLNKNTTNSNSLVSNTTTIHDDL